MVVLVWGSAKYSPNEAGVVYMMELTQDVRHM